MSKKEKTDIQKKFSLSKDDLGNIYGRLKIIDYTNALVKKDMYEYIRTVVMDRLKIPREYAVSPSPDWKEIVFVSPDDPAYKNVIEREEKETS